MYRYTTIECVPRLCEPTTISVDLSLLTSTLESIQNHIGYTPLEWLQDRGKQSSINLTHPPIIPQKYISRWGELAASYRISGNELEFIEQGIPTCTMRLMTDLVKSSYISQISEEIINYHRSVYNQPHAYIARILLSTLGPGTTYGLPRDFHTNTRYHIAITTNELCHMLVNIDSIIFCVHIPANGLVWHLTTDNMHSACNFSHADFYSPDEITRTHLIFTICCD